MGPRKHSGQAVPGVHAGDISKHSKLLWGGKKKERKKGDEKIASLGLLRDSAFNLSRKSKTAVNVY